MKLQNKVLTLVALSAAGQIAALGGFLFLERLQERQREGLSAIQADLERVRDFQAEFSDLSAQFSAASVSRAPGEMNSLRARIEDLISGLKLSSGYSGERALKAHGASYLEAARRLESAPSSFSAAVELRSTQESCFAAVRRLREETASAVSQWKETHRLAMADARNYFYLAEGAFAFFLLFLALNWIWDMRRSFQLLKRGLAFLGRGAVPPPAVMEARGDELGQVMSVLRHTAQQSMHLRQTMVRWDRLAAMGQVAGGVAHEINNPLSGVLGRAEMLLEKLPPEDANRAHVEHIVSSAQRCRKIVSNLLNFSRPRTSESAPVNLKTVWDSVMDITGSDLQKAGIMVESELREDFPPVWGNALELSEVFLNLVINAKDAMPEGGKLAVLADYLDEIPEPSHHVYSVSEGADIKKMDEIKGWMHIAFQDTGVGMSRETMRRLFESFYTTKEPGKGTGLGLPICLGIIKKHGGRMVVESDPGKGSVFSVFLPVFKGKE